MSGNRPRPTKQRCTTVPLLLAFAFAVGTSPVGFAATMMVVDAQGQWLEGGDGVEASGLAVDSDNQMWAVADSGALFQVRREGTNAQLGTRFEITKDGKPLPSDSEDLCALSSSRFLVVTERVPRLLEINRMGELLRQWPLSLNALGGDQLLHPNGSNTQLEGIACSGKELFFAYERPPRIFMLQVPDGESKTSKPLPLVPVVADLEGVYNLSGLHFVRHQGNDHLLALAPDQHLLLRLTLQRADGRVVAKTSLRAQVRFLSPNSRELCRAKPEGITVTEGKIWIVSDPPIDGTYRELDPGESRTDCESRGPGEKIGKSFRRFVPILFHLPLDAILQAVPEQKKVESTTGPAPAQARQTQPKAEQATSPQASRTDRKENQKPDGAGDQEWPYGTIRWEIERARRQGNTRALQRSILEIDREMAVGTDLETTTCWELLKGAVLVDLGQADNAGAMFGMIADTCPTWEAFNNVAVLQAADGQFGPAAANLRQAVKCAGTEARLPLGNLRKLFAGEDQLSLILVGAAKVCLKNQIPRANCSACEVPND